MENYYRHTKPESEPLTLAEAKVHLRIDHDDEDDYITGLIKVAREFIENETGYIPMESSWYGYLQSWPRSDYIFINKIPVTEITAVEYYASEDATEYTELASSDYDKAEHNSPPCVLLKDKPTLGDKLNPIRVSFKAGYSEVTDVNSYVIHAMKILIGHLYSNRQEEITGTQINTLEKGFSYLLDRIKIMTA